MDASGGGGLTEQYRVLRSTVANNLTAGTSGGLDTASSVVINSTFIGNAASEGGGIFSGSSTGKTSKVFSSALAGNSATNVGGGIRNGGGDGVFTIANTLLAGNSATNGGPDCAGNITSQDNNLVQSTSGCGFIAFGSEKTGITAGLASPTNKGGPTAGSSLGVISAMQTRSPLPDSPLVDSGNSLGCRDDNDVELATDQIGRDRAIDGLDVNTAVECDIGAIEFSVLLFEDGFE